MYPQRVLIHLVTGSYSILVSRFLFAGSHVLPGYYSMRRPFLQDSEFCHPMKQYSPDTYSSALGSKGFTYDHPSSYPPFIDSYYNPDSYGDYRGPTSYATSGGALFPPSTLPTLLPSLTGEASSHLLLVDLQLNFSPHY